MIATPFLGEDEHNMDAKGRVAIPARHRAQLGEPVYVGRGLRGQINVYPEVIFKEIIERIEQAGDDAAGLGRLVRLVYSTNRCDPDRQGRILIPPALRRYADLTGEIVVLGHGDHLEIWNPEQWHHACQTVVARNDESPDDFRLIARLVGEI